MREMTDETRRYLHCMSEIHPKLRPLDIRRHVRNGQSYLVLRDPLELSESSLLVPQQLAAVLAFCDGHRDIGAMADAYQQTYRMRIDRAAVADLIAALDAAYLLDNDRSRAAIAELHARYRSAPFRPAMLAGLGYPDAPSELAHMFDDLLAKVPAATSAQEACAGLLSPHIDYPRGGSVYAQVWAQAEQAAREAELVILFGTDHYGDDPFTLTRQNYATPYGVLPTATGVIDDLALHLGEDAAFAGELRHRDEHSLELPAVWLHHMRRGDPVEVVPILTGSFYRFMAAGRGPDGDSALETVIDRLAVAARGKRVLVLASGDLAHVGPAFGGAPLTGRARDDLFRTDTALMQTMQDGDYGAFYRAIARVENGNNVCGVSPIYLTMRLVARLGSGAVQGKQFGYAVCPADDADTSVVTVCGMTFCG